MNYLLILKQLLSLCTVISLTALPACAQDSAVDKKKKAAEEESKPALRILCVASLKGSEDIMLASKDEDGKWVMYTKKAVSIRPRFISQWYTVEKKTVHLVKKTDENIESLGKFEYPQSSKRIILVIIPDKKEGKYLIDVIDPSAIAFSKGKALVANYSNQPAIAKLGSAIKTVQKGEKIIMKPGPDDNGMYRMTLGYSNKKKKIVPCFDRYVSYSEESRDFLLLFPDSRQPGFAVFSLAEFGPFE